MSYPRIADWKIALMRRMAAAGCTKTQMARALHFTKQRAWQLCRRYGITTRHDAPQRRPKRLTFGRRLDPVTEAKKRYWEGAA